MTRQPLVVVSHESLLSNDRVFFGNQSDEFALATVIGRPRRLCVLGLGLGAAVRTITALAPDVEIVAVDHDRHLVDACQALHQAYLPDVTFEAVVADARDFAERHPGAFDTAVVDLFGSSAYAPAYFDPEFWAAVHSMLGDGGAVLVNAWGLPAHLEPLTAPSPQLAVAAQLTARWGNVRMTCHRRNATFIATDEPVDELVRWPSPRRLGSPVDEALARCLPLRAAAAPPVRPPPMLMDHPTEVSEIDDEFRRRLPPFLAELQAAGAPPLGDGQSPGSYLRSLLLDRRAAVDVTLELLESGNERASFLPAYVASFRFEQSAAYDWFLEWLAENLSALDGKYPQWTRHAAVWQSLSVLANPLAMAPPPAGDLLAALGDLPW